MILKPCKLQDAAIANIRLSGGDVNGLMKGGFTTIASKCVVVYRRQMYIILIRSQ